MSPRLVEEVCRELAALSRSIGDIKPGSHRRPQDFPEAILAAQKRVRAIEVRVRQTFGGRVIPNSAGYQVKAEAEAKEPLPSWAERNLALRRARDAMDEIKRQEQQAEAQAQQRRDRALRAERMVPRDRPT